MGRGRSGGKRVEIKPGETPAKGTVVESYNFNKIAKEAAQLLLPLDMYCVVTLAFLELLLGGYGTPLSLFSLALCLIQGPRMWPDVEDRSKQGMIAVAFFLIAAGASQGFVVPILADRFLARVFSERAAWLAAFITGTMGVCMLMAQSYKMRRTRQVAAKAAKTGSDKDWLPDMHK